MGDDNSSIKKTVLFDIVERAFPHHCFCLWKLHPDKGKVPLTVKDNQLIYADVTNPDDLLDFAQAHEAFQNFDVSGIGVALINGNNNELPTICIDLDDCFDVDGNLSSFAADIVDRFKDTYIEISQSGRGLHIFFFDSFADDLKNFKSERIEIYSHHRYIAVTGHILNGNNGIISFFDGVTAKLLQEFDQNIQAVSSFDFNKIISEHSLPPEVDTSLLLSIIRNSNSTRLLRLLDGDIASVDGDDSRADFHAALKLCWWTNGNAPQIDDIISQSTLGKRDKWIQRKDYRDRTIAKAIVYWNGEHFKRRPTKAERTDNALAILDNIVNSGVHGNITNAELLDNAVFHAAAFIRNSLPAAFDQFIRFCKANKLNISEFRRQVNSICKKIERNEQSYSKSVPFIHQSNVKLPALPSAYDFNINDIIVPDFFALDYDGTYQFVPDRFGNLQRIKISQSAIIVSGIARNDDSGCYKSQIAGFNKGFGWRISPHISDNIIASSQKIVELASFGLDINSANSKAVIQYIAAFKAANPKLIPRSVVVNNTGWRDDGVFVYPNAQADIKLDDDVRCSTERVFSSHGDINVVKRLLKIAFDNDTVALIAGTALAAPLVHILRAQNIVLHVYGTTGSGKTVASRFALSLFSNPNVPASMPTANATKVGLEAFFAAHRDLPSVIDDIDSISDEKTKAVIRDLPYQFANRIGKLRAKRNGGNDIVLEFRGSLITTGEQPLTDESSTAGAKRRVIEHSVHHIFDHHIVSSFIHPVLDNFGLIGATWIDAISNNSDFFKDLYLQLLNGGKVIANGLAEQFSAKIPLHIDNICVIATAIIACRHLLLGEPLNTIINAEAERAARILEFLPDNTEIGDGVRAMPFIRDWIYSHPKNFMHADADDSDIADPADAFETFGVIKKDCIAVFPSILKRTLASNGFRSPDMIIQQLAKDGYIIKNNGSNKPTKVVNINGKSTRMIVLNITASTG